jgi:hypothetical protein
MNLGICSICGLPIKKIIERKYKNTVYTYAVHVIEKNGKRERKYCAVKKEILEQKKDEKSKKEEKIEKVADEVYHHDLRQKAVDPRKPILTKEIQDTAWFHNLIHDVGKHVVSVLWGSIPWTSEMLKDHTKAYDAFVKRFNTLLESVEKADLVEELRKENKAYEAILLTVLDGVEAMKKIIDNYERYSNIVCETLCPSCRTKVMSKLIAYGVVQ